MRALIVATGPSLKREDVEWWSAGRKVYAVSNAYRYCDRVDLLYACDEQWYDVHEPSTRHIAERWTTCDAAATKYGLHHIPGHYGPPAFDTGDAIAYGGNSGFQALNLAYIHGCCDAVLLGFDCGQEPGGPSHCFGEHPSACDNPRPYRRWLEHWRKAAPEIAAAGMVVRNATRGGWLDVFPRVAR